MQYLETIQQGLLDRGFTVGESYRQLESVGTNALLILLSGFGVAAGLMMLLLKMGLPKLSVLGFVGTVLCWLGLFMVSPILARKLMALAGVIIYPTLGCISIMTPQRCNIVQALGRILAMSAVSFLGAVFMVGLLADALFMMKLDAFVGVKIAHIIPILAVPFILYLWQGGLWTNCKKLLSTAMTYQWVILGVVVAVAGIIYISRTGNASGELSVLESSMRTALNDWLGVRPRSKEFLIGYPFAMLLFYLGASRKNWIFTLPAVIGQVSLVNTYAHIHTPLLISLERSFNGMALGLILGILLILAVKGAEQLWKKQMERSEKL